MVGYTPLGLELFEIRFADSTVSLRNRSSMPEYVPRFMLADMYLTFWPRTLLNENLMNAVVVDQLLEESSGECVDVPFSGSQWRRVRQIVSGDTVLVSIHYTSLEPWRGEALYRHLDRQYFVHVKTLTEEG